jgi:hypothetical protein
MNYLNFSKFIELASSEYNSCVSLNNPKYESIIDFIVETSKNINIDIEKLIILCKNISSDEITKKILINQHKIDPNYIKNIIKCNTVTTSNKQKIYFIQQCFSLKKHETIKYIMNDIDINVLFECVIQCKNFITTNFEEFICNYIEENYKTIQPIFDLKKLINIFTKKPKIIKSVFTVVSNNITSTEKLEILNSIIEPNIDLSIILLILESNDVMPNTTTITNLIKTIYGHNHEINSIKKVAEIIDIFVLFGFKITREIVFLLLKKKCYINNIEKYFIDINDEMLVVCAELNFYPYNYNCIPSQKVMLIECKKEENLLQIKKLTEKGAVINIECLETACKVNKNSKVIKYMINDCKMKPNDNCLKNFQSIYNIEPLDILMQNYSNNNEQHIKINNKIELDNESTMTIEPKQTIVIQTDGEYLLKTKINKLLNYNKKIIKYYDLYELMLKYLINHKLVIGNYFVINNELCNLFKINQCALINIDQLDNILSYFIDTVENNEK